MLGRLRSIARGEHFAVTPSPGVTATSRLRQKLPELRQLRPLRLKDGEWEDKVAEASLSRLLALEEPDAEAIEERAGLAADRVPPVYLDAWARLNHQKPVGVSETEWRLALDDGGRFLDAFGSEAAELRWMPGELFDVRSGLVWRFAGERVEAIGADHVRLSDGRAIERKSAR
jgi:hypothetical protein